MKDANSISRRMPNSVSWHSSLSSSIYKTFFPKDANYLALAPRRMPIRQQWHSWTTHLCSDRYRMHGIERRRQRYNQGGNVALRAAGARASMRGARCARAGLQ